MAKKEIKDKKTTSKRKSKKEEVENEIKPEGNKIYLYNVRVINKNGDIVRRYIEQTSKEIEEIKKTLEPDEKVRYMPVAFRY